MPLTPRPFPPALPHGEIRELFPDVFFVTGTVAMPGPLPVRFSRNMTILREGTRLVLLNTVRLDEAGLAALDKLGTVTDVIRIAGNHGQDDPFYADRYKAKVWVVPGQRYTAGFDTSSPTTYFEPHGTLDEKSLPVANARLYTFRSEPTEAMLLLARDGGICIAGDALQHWHTTDEYFSFMGRVMLPLFGFIKPHNVGPGWLKQCKPPKEDLAGVLALEFTHVVPAHGAPVIGGAREKYRPVLEKSGRG